MRDDLAVGLGDETIALRLEALAQRLEVLDDAVVHDRDLVAAGVRMRVRRRRCAVRGPARMRDAGGAGDPGRCGLRRQVGDARGTDQPLKCPIDDGEPG